MPEVKALHLVVALGAVLAVAGCDCNARNAPIERNMTDYFLDESTFDHATVEMVQKDIGLRLPAGSRGLNMFYQGSTLDPAFVAQIEIPASAADELASRIKKIREAGTISESLSKKVTWWNPAVGAVLVDRQSDPNGDYLHLVLSREKERVVLYVEWCKV
jgi:hypothetical protein